MNKTKPLIAHLLERATEISVSHVPESYNVRMLPGVETGSRSGSTQSIGMAGQATPLRLASIDIFRGLTIMVMVFVNDLASVKGLPWWTYHAPGNVDAMTYVDMVFPAFLFIVGMAIPLAISARLKKMPAERSLWVHVLLRSLSLVVLGLILANAEKGDPRLMAIRPNWWAFIALIGAFLVWNVYPRTAIRRLRLLGLAVLIVMFAIFRRTTSDGHVAWIDFSYWEILGLIGWAYLSACILYIPTRRFWWAPMGWFLCLLGLNVASTAGWLAWLSHLPSYIWPFDNGASCLIVMGGIVTTRIFSSDRRWLWAGVFATGCLMAGWLLTPLGISKIRATPTWCLYCMAASVAIYAVLFWICDVKKRTKWAGFVRPAGSNTLTAYLIPDLFYFAAVGGSIEAAFAHGSPGVMRAVVFTLVMLGLAAVATRMRIRLQL